MTRTIFFRVFCALFGALCVLLSLASVAQALSNGGPGGHVHVLLLGHAAVLGTLATGFLIQLHRPELRVAAWQMVLVTVVLLEGVALFERIPDPAFEIGFPLALLLTGVLHPTRGRLFRLGPTISPLLAPVALLAVVPAAVGAGRLHDQTAGLTGELLLAVQAGTHVAMTVPFLGLLAALHTVGWRVPLRSAGAITVVVGIASVGYPEEVDSLGMSLGMVAAIVGIVFVTLGEWEARRTNRLRAAEITVNVAT